MATVCAAVQSQSLSCGGEETSSEFFLFHSDNGNGEHGEGGVDKPVHPEIFPIPIPKNTLGMTKEAAVRPTLPAPIQS